MNLSECGNESDRVIVERALASPDFFGCLILRYEHSLARFIRRISGFTDEDIAEILQEAFLKAYRNLNAFDHDLKFSTWLYRIVHNQTIDFQRHKKTTSNHEVMIDSESEGKLLAVCAHDLDARVDRDRIHDVGSAVIGTMPEKLREAFVLRFIEEKDYAEIGDILQKPAGTVATLIRRGQKYFIREMKRKFNGGER